MSDPWTIDQIWQLINAVGIASCIFYLVLHFVSARTGMPDDDDDKPKHRMKRPIAPLNEGSKHLENDDGQP